MKKVRASSSVCVRKKGGRDGRRKGEETAKENERYGDKEDKINTIIENKAHDSIN